MVTIEMYNALLNRVEKIEAQLLINDGEEIKPEPDDEPEVNKTPSEWWRDLFKQPIGSITPFGDSTLTLKNRYGEPYLEWSVNGKTVLLGKYFDPRTGQGYRKYFTEEFNEMFGAGWQFEPITTTQKISGHGNGLVMWAFSCGERKPVDID